jgi:hypothetical protein
VVHTEADGGAERVADDEQRDTRHVGRQHVERGEGVEALLGEVAALAAGAGTEVEPEGGDVRLRQGTEERGDDGVEAVAAEAGMRVQQDGGAPCPGGDDQVGGEAHPVRRHQGR